MPAPTSSPLSHHRFSVTVEWTGNRGDGTTGYRGYGRDHTVRCEGRPELLGSAEPAFRGDPDRWNPELLLVAALSECHLMSYLHACVRAGVVVTGYRDEATGAMTVDPDGSGRFTEVVLRPHVTVAEPVMAEAAQAAHADAHRMCFIANSVSFPVRHEPRVVSG